MKIRHLLGICLLMQPHICLTIRLRGYTPPRKKDRRQEMFDKIKREIELERECRRRERETEERCELDFKKLQDVVLGKLKKTALSYACKSQNDFDVLLCMIMTFDVPSITIDEINIRTKMIDLLLEADVPNPWSSRTLFKVAMVDYLEGKGSFAMICHMLSRCADRDSKFMADAVHVARYHDHPRLARFIDNYGKTLQERVADIIRQNPALNIQAKTHIPSLLQSKLHIGDGKEIEEKDEEVKYDSYLHEYNLASDLY